MRQNNETLQLNPDQISQFTSDTPEQSHEGSEKKTIIRSKRNVIASTHDVSGADDGAMGKKISDEEQESAAFPEQNTHRSYDEVNIGKRDQVLRAKDAVFEGRGVIDRLCHR